MLSSLLSRFVFYSLPQGLAHSTSDSCLHGTAETTFTRRGAQCTLNQFPRAHRIRDRPGAPPLLPAGTTHILDDSARGDFVPWGHVAMSGDILIVIKWEGGVRMLLTSNR